MKAPIELLERAGELATIDRALDRARDGEGGLLLIEGEAGAGKTSLLDAAGRMAAEREMLVLRARGGEYERDFPYGVVRQLFEPVLVEEGRRAELLDGTAGMAAPVFSPGVAPEKEVEPAGLQHGLYWLTVDLAAAAPLALLVDDAQWADVASLRALVYVARRLDDLPAVLGLTVRTGEPGEHLELLDELRREPIARSLVPPPLSAGAAEALIADGAGRRSTGGFAAACCHATAGNPLLLVELLRALDAEGVGPGEASAERLAEIAAAGISSSVLVRLGRLGEGAVAVARAVAVLEPNAEPRRVAALAGLPGEAVAAASERLISAHMLFDARPLGFVHPLVRAAVLSEIPAPRRAAAHARAARLLGDDGSGSDTVAAHLLLSEPAAESWVVTELRAAAVAALARGAPDAAVRYLRRALREPPGMDDRLGVSLELGEALLRVNDPEGIGVLRTVRAATEDGAKRAEIAIVLAGALGIRDGSKEAVSVLEESLAEVSDLGGRLGLLLRGNLILQGMFGLERVPEMALPRPGENIDGETTESRLVLQVTGLLEIAGIGTVEGGMERIAQAIADPDAVREDAMAGLPSQGAMVAATLADRGDLIDDLFESAIDAARRRGAMAGVAGGHGIRSLCRFFDGDLREAQGDSETAIPLVRRFGFSVPLAIYLGVAARTLVARGDCAGAEELLAEYWTGWDQLSGGPAAMLHCARGELRRASGRHAEARHDFLVAAEHIDWLPRANLELYPWRTGLASCEAALGNEEEAWRLSEEALELAREAGGRRGIGIALRGRGTLTEGAEGVEVLGEAVEVLAATRAKLQYAHALVDLGAALRRANRRKDAREPLREGLDLAHRCGAAPLEERARTELAATGARPRKAVLRGVDSLTPSELRVARLAVDGMTNREIAQELFVTAKTVETHLRHVYQKLDVKRRAELPGVLGPS